MTLPEQLKWMKKKNAYDREKKDQVQKEAKEKQEKRDRDKSQPKASADAFDPNADPSTMSLPQQLQWNKQKIAYLANQKLSQEKEESKTNTQEEKKQSDTKDEEPFDPNADLSNMTLQEQLAWNKKNLEYKAKQKKITQERNEDDEFALVA